MQENTKNMLFKGGVGIGDLTAEQLVEDVIKGGPSGFSPRIADILLIAYISRHKNIPQSVVNAVFEGQDRKVVGGRQVVNDWNQYNDNLKDAMDSVTMDNFKASLCVRKGEFLEDTQLRVGLLAQSWQALGSVALQIVNSTP